jgi:rhomboid protease GluP
MFLVQLAVELLLPAEAKQGGGGGLFSFLSASSTTYILLGANFTPQVLDGQVWRFVTYSFLHIGLLHILFNGWAMWDLGRLVERMWGGAQLFATFILTGIAGGAVSFAMAAFVMGEPRLSAGASGSICGVLGLLLGAYYKNRYHIGEYLGSQLLRWAVYILVFGLVAGADNSAHIGGMLAGGALGYFMPPTRTTNTAVRDARVWRFLTIASVILLAAAYAFAALFAVRVLLFPTI